MEPAGGVEPPKSAHNAAASTERRRSFPTATAAPRRSFSAEISTSLNDVGVGEVTRCPGSVSRYPRWSGLTTRRTALRPVGGPGERHEEVQQGHRGVVDLTTDAAAQGHASDDCKLDARTAGARQV